MSGGKTFIPDPDDPGTWIPPGDGPDGGPRPIRNPVSANCQRSSCALANAISLPTLPWRP